MTYVEERCTSVISAPCSQKSWAMSWPLLPAPTTIAFVPAGQPFAWSSLECSTVPLNSSRAREARDARLAADAGREHDVRRAQRALGPVGPPHAHRPAAGGLVVRAAEISVPVQTFSSSAVA